ncbi:MAG: hypothetical protein KA713_11830 [Chryseotalea sp. WA131a]|nr:MAG: hypothetical protein KA713_11830 [Chryseotalea sp. WA131a]
MKTNKVLYAILLCLSCLKSFSQQNDVQAALFNVGTGGLIGGIGSMINKKPNEKLTKLFLRGFAKGATGGLLVYGSKKLIYQYGDIENPSIAWGSKLMNAAGMSIIENAASNNKFLKTWHLNFGFNRLEIDIETRVKFRYKVMPYALYGFIYCFSRGNLSFSETFKLGHPIFFTDSLKINTYSSELAGTTLTNSILMSDKYYSSKQISHEIIHVLQFEAFGSLNTFFDKPRNELFMKEYKVIKFYKKWIYTDATNSIFSGLYLLNVDNSCFLNNSFEAEANFYSFKWKCN